MNNMDWKLITASDIWIQIDQAIAHMEEEKIAELTRSRGLSDTDLRYIQGYLSALRELRNAPIKQESLNRLQSENAARGRQ